MSARPDSRNEVFLSALDLFSLLLFAFLWLAFAHRPGAGGLSMMSLPAVDHAQTPGPAGPSSIFLEWKSDADRAGRRGEPCMILVRERSMKSAPAELRVDCWPKSFDQDRQRYRSEDLRGKTEAWHQAVIACPTDAGNIEACARLQWLAVDYGFHVSAAVKDLR